MALINWNIVNALCIIFIANSSGQKDHGKSCVSSETLAGLRRILKSDDDLSSTYIKNALGKMDGDMKKIMLSSDGPDGSLARLRQLEDVVSGLRSNIQSLKCPPSPSEALMLEIRDILKQNSILLSAQGRREITRTVEKYRDCSSLDSKKGDGVYDIYPDGATPVKAYCDMTTDGGRWTVFQRRNSGDQDFYQPWEVYKQGFGKPEAEYWLGLDSIYDLTKGRKCEMRVDLEDFNGTMAHAVYDDFSIGSEADLYRLQYTGHTGTAGTKDSLLGQAKGMQFSTYDKDNDLYFGNCAERFHGAWWYKTCLETNLNGRHGFAVAAPDYMVWHGWREWNSIKGSKMMLRCQPETPTT